MIVVLPAGHRLSDRDTVPLRELEGEPHVIWARSGAPRIHDAYVRACYEAGFTPQILQEIERGESFLGLVEANLGVSTAHASNAQIQRPGVRYAKIVEPTVPLTLGVAYRRDDESSLLDRFLETVEAEQGSFEQTLLWRGVSRSGSGAIYAMSPPPRDARCPLGPASDPERACSRSGVFD
jgi:DNA-binding transcriptional LysR family regulator